MTSYGCLTMAGVLLAGWVGTIWLILKLVETARHPNEEDRT